jgi:general secretion pathway protein I
MNNHHPANLSKEGFSLIEVLVGLAILAIAMISGMKALTQTVQTQTVLQQQYHAMISANDILNQMYSQKAWPEFTPPPTNCSQLNTPLVCIQKSINTPNPLFKRVEIEVFESSQSSPTEPRGQRLAKLTAILFNYQASSL